MVAVVNCALQLDRGTGARDDTAIARLKQRHNLLDSVADKLPSTIVAIRSEVWLEMLEVTPMSTIHIATLYACMHDPLRLSFAYLVPC